MIPHRELDQTGLVSLGGGWRQASSRVIVCATALPLPEKLTRYNLLELTETLEDTIREGPPPITELLKTLDLWHST